MSFGLVHILHNSRNHPLNNLTINCLCSARPNLFLKFLSVMAHEVRNLCSNPFNIKVSFVLKGTFRLLLISGTVPTDNCLLLSLPCSERWCSLSLCEMIASCSFLWCILSFSQNALIFYDYDTSIQIGGYYLLVAFSSVPCSVFHAASCKITVICGICTLPFCSVPAYFSEVLVW